MYTQRTTNAFPPTNNNKTVPTTNFPLIFEHGPQQQQIIQPVLESLQSPGMGGGDYSTLHYAPVANLSMNGMHVQPAVMRMANASSPMIPMSPASMPRALHDLLHRLHWVAGTPAEHQICYKDMSYVRRGTLYACIKRFMLGEKRDNNVEKLYSDITDALEHLRYYYLTGNSDYVEKIANALVDIYETLSVIGRTTYYDDRSILSRLLVIRSEIKSALTMCGLAKGIMLSPDDDLQIYVMKNFAGMDNGRTSLSSQSIPSVNLPSPTRVAQHSYPMMMRCGGHAEVSSSAHPMVSEPCQLQQYPSTSSANVSVSIKQPAAAAKDPGNNDNTVASTTFTHTVDSMNDHPDKLTSTKEEE